MSDDDSIISDNGGITSSSSEDSDVEKETPITQQELLIQEVKERPCLTTKSDEKYMDKQYKEKQWEDIAQVLQTNGFHRIKDKPVGQWSTAT